MFTSEVVLQWRLKVGREALEMIMCFAFFFPKRILWNEGGDTKDLLEELVKTSHLKVILDELTCALKGNVGKPWLLILIWT